MKKISVVGLENDSFKWCNLNKIFVFSDSCLQKLRYRMQFTTFKNKYHTSVWTKKKHSVYRPSDSVRYDVLSRGYHQF